MLERILTLVVIAVLAVAAYGVVQNWQRRRARDVAQRTGTRDRAELLIFTSPTCAPCKYQQLPIVERVMAEWHDRVVVQLIDVVERPEVARQYGVWSVPTTIVLSGEREVVALNIGVTREPKLRDQLARATMAVDQAAPHAVIGSAH